jgi:hypothetical protein
MDLVYELPADGTDVPEHVAAGRTVRVYLLCVHLFCSIYEDCKQRRGTNNCQVVIRARL